MSTRICISLYLAFGVAAVAQCQVSLIDRLTSSRSSHPSICAIYTETIKVYAPPAASEGELGWGASSSESNVECGFDSKSSYIKYLTKESEANLKSGGQRTYFNIGTKAYEFIESGKRGNFGSHAHGMTNPLAFGYEVYGEPANKYVIGKDLHENAPLIQCKTSFSEEALTIQKFDNGQSAIQTLHGKTDLGYVNQGSVSSWKRVGKVYIPEIVTMEITKGGSRFQTRKWKLISIKSLSDDPIKLNLREGASIKDEDSNVVYVVQGGKLVIDPVFSKEASDSATIRRTIFLGSILVFIAWLCYRMWNRRPARASM